VDPGELDPRPEARRAELEALIAVLEPLAAAGARAWERGTPAADFALGALGVARELALGVLAEADAGRGGNAGRLARHLFEQWLELAYVLADPVPRLRQLEAREAHLRLRVDVAYPDPEGRMAPEDSEPLEALRAEGKLRDATVADRFGRERGTPPTLRGMAEWLGCVDEYDLSYRWASLHAHPGLLPGLVHLEVTPTGSIRLRSEGEGTRTEQAAPAAKMAQMMVGDALLSVVISLTRVCNELYWAFGQPEGVARGLVAALGGGVLMPGKWPARGEADAG